MNKLPPRVPCRWLSWLLLLAAALACATFIPSEPTPSSDTAPGPAGSGLIAYLGADGNLYTIEPDSGERSTLTDDALHPSETDGSVAVYQSPTWSHDASRLAFIRFHVLEGLSHAFVMVYDLATGGTTEVFSSGTENPIYLYWAPDSRRITFLTTFPGSTDLNLRIGFLDGSESQVVDMGQPYYWVWSPDGAQIFTHVGGAAINNPAAHLAILSPSGELVRTFEFSPDFFQAPSWSPDGERLLFGLQGDLQGSLVLMDRDGANLQTLAEFDSQIAFSWSPDGVYVATLATQVLMGGFQGTLSVLRPGAADATVANVPDTVIAYFWSPDSRKLAYLAVNTSGGVDALMGTNRQENPGLSLNVLDVAGGVSQRLVTLQPTRSFLTVIPFFDQYHHSATIWSPDSSRLVYTSRDANGEEGVWVVGVTGDEPPLRVADGSLAFWSWK